MKIHETRPYIDKNQNCMYAAVGNVLSWYNLDHAFIQAIFDSQLEFFYSRQKQANLSFRLVEEVVFDFVLEKSSLKRRLAELLSDYGMRVCWNESPDDQQSWREICEAVVKQPIVLFVDQFFVPYHSLYGQRHGGHFVTLLGHADGGTSYILDSITPVASQQAAARVPSSAVNMHMHCAYHGPIPDSTLLKARSLDAPLIGVDNGWIQLEVNQQTKRSFDAECLFKTCQRVAEAMLLRRATEDRFWGVKGIRVFARDMLSLISAAHSMDELMTLSPTVERSFNALSISMTRVIQQRQGLSDLLRRVAQTSEDSPLRSQCIRLHSAYHGIANEWTIVRNIFYISNAKRSLNRLVSAPPRLEGIAVMEEQAAEQLAKMADRLKNVA